MQMVWLWTHQMWQKSEWLQRLHQWALCLCVRVTNFPGQQQKQRGWSCFYSMTSNTWRADKHDEAEGNLKVLVRKEKEGGSVTRRTSLNSKDRRSMRRRERKKVERRIRRNKEAQKQSDGEKEWKRHPLKKNKGYEKMNKDRKRTELCKKYPKHSALFTFTSELYTNKHLLFIHSASRMCSFQNLQFKLGTYSTFNLILVTI